MASRSLKTLIALTLTASALSGPRVADAAGKKDKEATKLVNQALDEDYLSLEFDKAETKLKKALKTCGKDDCSAEVVGKIHVALATVHGVGQKKLDVAKADLVAALKADPEAKLIDGLNPPELEAKFKEAKAEAGGGGEGGEGGEAGKGGEGGEGGKGGEGGGAPVPSADFNHTPIPEQAVNTPVPVFAEIPEDLGAEKVIVRYKPYGGTKWESLNLEKMDGGFGGVIPCDAVTTTGELKYYIIGTDAGGTPIATAGSLKQPYKVRIKNKISGDKPSLPDQPPPKKCAAAEDCPPGLPGCKGGGSDRGDKIEGSSCDATTECMAGLICLNGVCAPGGDEPPKESSGAHHYISVTAQFDLAYVGSGEDVCSSKSSASYICTHQTDEAPQFFGKPRDVKGTNGISGGLAFGGARLFAGYDYEFDFDVIGLGLGARIGYAFGGPNLGDELPPDYNEDGKRNNKDYPKGQSFLPVHAEGRVQLRFMNPTMKGGDFAPHAFLGGGAAQVNASVPVTVCDEAAEGADLTVKCPGETKVDAYQLTGLSFFSFGGGATYLIVDNFGISADLKFMVMFPTVGFVIAPSISPVLAF